MTAVRVSGLYKSYGSVEALRDVSLEVGWGEVVALLGPNGSGKTTLLNIVAGVLKPSRGEVRICGKPVGSETKRLVGFMPQESAFYSELSVADNMAFYARLYGIKPDKQRFRELLSLVGLEGCEQRKVGSLSGGMKRKLALAVTLVHDPKILLLDEPTTGMDPGARRAFWRIVREAAGEDKAILLSTHYAEEAEQVADRCIIMHKGRVIAEGSPASLKQRYGGEAVISITVEGGDSVPEILSDFGRVVSAGNSTYHIYTENPHSCVPQVISKLYSAGIAVRLVEVREPNLENVFVNLTGVRLE